MFFFSNKNEHNKLICCRLSPSSWPIWSKWDYLSDEAYLEEVSHWVHVLGNVYPPTLISWLLQNEHFCSSMALCHHGALPLHCMGKCSKLIKDWISQTEGDNLSIECLSQWKWCLINIMNTEFQVSRWKELQACIIIMSVPL